MGFKHLFPFPGLCIALPLQTQKPKVWKSLRMRQSPTNKPAGENSGGRSWLCPRTGGKEQEAELLIPSQLHHPRSQTDIPVSVSPQGLVARLPMEQDRCQMPRQPPTHTPGILGSKGSSDWKKNKWHLKKMCFSCLAQHSTARNTLRSCCSWP